MRASSVTLPSSSRGTLKSTRTRTRLPSTSRSSSVRTHQHLLRELYAAVRVTPLVVVPGDDLDEVALQDARQQRVEDRRVRVADDARGDDRVIRVAQDAVAGGRLHRVVDLLDARVAAGHDREVDDRAGRDGGADCEAVQLAVEVGNDEPDRLRRARGGGHEVDR